MYRIVDWHKHFENNRTRELKRLDWVPFPNKQDGDGYTELVEHPDGPAHFGVWCALVEVASKCDPRGTLSRDGARPHDARSLARVTRFPERILQEALDRLTNEIKWVEVVADVVVDKELTTIPHDDATAPHDDASRARARREGNGREVTPIPLCLDSEEFRIAWDEWNAHRTEIKKPLKPTQAQKQLKMLSKLGTARAVAMIEHTIEKGWQGLRESEGVAAGVTSAPAIKPADVPRHIPKVKLT